MSETPDNPMSDRVLALAGLVQALSQVRRIADTGQANTAALSTVLDSVFRIDAESPAEVYGGRHALMPGLTLLKDYFEGRNADPQLPRLAMAVMQLERRFVRDDEMASRVHRDILALGERARADGSTHPDVMAALGTLYAETLSHLRPRVLVQGNPHYLGQASVVAEVRAALLAGVRSAVLWRQMGGSLLDFLLAKGRMRESVHSALR